MNEAKQEPVAWIGKHGVLYYPDEIDLVPPINEPQPLYLHPSTSVNQRIAELEAQNAQLLEFVREWLVRQGTDENYMVAKARAAIAAAEKER